MTEHRDRGPLPGTQPRELPGPPPRTVVPRDDERDTGPRHETFTVEQHLDAPAATVFAAFRDTAVRRRWLRLPGTTTFHHHDFRVGGGETVRSIFTTLDNTPEHLEHRARYIDIVPDRSIVHVYEARVDDTLRWTSLVTVGLRPQPRGTVLRWTEQVAFITPTGDGSHDLPHLRGATRLRLNGLIVALASPHGTAP
ncbi:SRPBCC domain-containing protein [Yinghuangia sp. ASG 101]|uniref:SRPBCC domain-containing protein n=1 Tax=Yinghuangia sp. ASG 101 TaxID=2896848 RepID=UPI001E55FAA8|nr:SRPBCC domain-containing protein [Yinghuangia sp. ASG 101]UGQ11375.1 SRPBCC domain-containing protein [Yinghuangia sp. ASG 101]